MNRQGVARRHRGRRQRLRGIGLAAASLLVATALVAQTGVTTDATWNDTEWAHNTVGTVDCTNPAGAFATRGEGRVLSGSLLGFDLDTIAEAKGVEVTNNGERSISDPSSADDLGNHAYANPLDVEALNTANIGLTGLLEIPLNTETGVVGQYGQATERGASVGAAGTVTDDGGISLEQYEGDVPDLATLKLSAILNAPGVGLGTLLEDVADLSLTIGAVGGRAWLDGCMDAWALPGAVTRDYVASHADLDLTSPTVSALGKAVSDITDTLESTANGLIGNSSLLSGVLGDVVDVVTVVLNTVTTLVGLRVGSTGQTATIEALTLDLDPVQDLLNSPFGDEVVAVTLSKGLVHIDTVALLAAAYEDSEENPYPHGLNGLPPNTNPLQDPAVLDTLGARLTATLKALVGELETALLAVIQNASVRVQISLPVQRCSAGPAPLGVCGLGLGTWNTIGALGISIEGTISQLISNDPEAITIDASVLEAIPVLGELLAGLVEDIVEGLVGDAILNTIGGLIDDQLNGAVSTSISNLETLIEPIVLLVTDVYRELFIKGVVALLVNAQNDPQTGHPEPAEWAALLEGRYNVSAIRVGVLDALDTLAVWVHLGRGSVGVNCSVAHAAVPGSPCANY
ncbi:MAG: choice-of-anchor G family protein [Leucobacter sp.]